jgi:hypothetical protein
MVLFEYRFGITKLVKKKQNASAHTDKIAQQAQSGCTALFRMELDPECGVPANGRCKGAYIVR